MAAHHEASSSSSSSSASGLSTYEVFLSFHGKDVRTNFADHLYYALVDAGIQTFRDEDKLQKGSEIGPELLIAIQESRISIPIFSENYASSKWCLNELAEISECIGTRNQIVLPIFYKVEPRDVRNQSGTYAKAFEEHHLMRSDKTMVQKWQKALEEVGKVDGWHCKEDTYEGKLMKEVVKTVWSSLQKRPLTISNNLVGIQSHTKEMLMLLDIESDDRKIVGIHGLGGIGKTTIAKVVCNTIFHHFEAYSFIENIQENAQKHGIIHLQKKLIFDMLKQENPNTESVDEGINLIRQRLFKRKVLIILDDVDQDIQVDSLAGDREWFGIGSKIIITSRNKDILTVRKADGIYEPHVMDLDDSLELLSHHAFGRDKPPSDYLDLSKTIVKITGGLPLALRVIGSSLFSKKKSVWEGMLKKLRKIPNNDVMKWLKISYDRLEDEEQQMFLDTACFFIGMDKDIACYIWEGCDYSPQIGLEVLCEKSLLTISEDGKLQMHDMLQDLGRDIVRQESIKNPGERSRIWSQAEVLEVLDKLKGTSNCEGLTIDFNRLSIDFSSKSTCLMSEGFAKMTNLRLLQVDYAQFSENFTNSFSELRWLSWRGCPDQYTLSNFCPQKLVVLDLSNSEITKDWMGWNYIKMAVNLKFLNLTSCHQLSSTLDVSANRLLEVLLLKDCQNLLGIDTSICRLRNLITLDMSGCSRIVDLPSENSQLISLKRLDLGGCENLKKLPKELGCMISLTVLVLRGCLHLVDIPCEICHLTSLETLDLSGCSSLLDLPSEISQLNSLKSLDLKGCENLKKLPKKWGQMISLTVLVLCGCSSLEDIPNEICHLTSLETLDLSGCSSLVVLPSEISQLTSLKRLDLKECKNLKKLPKKFGFMNSSTVLSLCGCSSLGDLPSEIFQLPSLETLHLSGCSSLVGLPSEICQLTSLKTLDLSGCTSILYLPIEICQLTSLERLFLYGCYSLNKLPKKLGSMTSLTTLDISHCGTLKSLPNLPSSLKYFDASDCILLTSLSMLSSLKNLRKLGLPPSLTSLDVRYCSSIQYISGRYTSSVTSLDVDHWSSNRDISGLPSSLTSLDVDHCSSIRDISGLASSLTSLNVSHCSSILDISCLPSSVLTSLNVSHCSSIEYISGLPSSLIHLDVRYCSSMQYISGLPSSLIHLDTSYCGSMIKLSTTSSGGLRNLKTLFLDKCISLEDIEGADEKLDSLGLLSTMWCRSLRRLPKLRGSNNLRTLKLYQNDAISSFEGEGMDSLEELEIEYCQSLRKIPYLRDFRRLRILQIKDCPELSEIVRLEDFQNLKTLSISEATSLKALPDISTLKNLRYLRIKWCDSMERLPDLSNLKRLRQLEIVDCVKLTEIPGLDRLESLEELKLGGCISIERLLDLSNLNKLNVLCIKRCKNLTEIYGVDGLDFLEILDINGCQSLERLPDLSNLKKLKELKAKDCKKLTEIRADGGLESLELLAIKGCISLEKLPDLTKSKKLRELCGLYL
ncbi:disease resistance protein RUN1-like [Macadamia integrifolia]|uniref:disease resistance protein RUN1-like n=1 Tax=Macadamia integrifolia TaxID=60698 RepID=UPI001C4F1C36|nr:disease resistance protein RUN1-like [Macadamia integrifolia]XP_042499499.1 disease resistance protein RUN1-like [Macadamia integrifolia]XP_042499506.1 disease resistance protein RUN1-like [Macadamia integrifolia]XP_042499508.1 disease resistance protein RUN1-like [Macadamia integrifolia]XP_042499509.1 disease resistance protein RUN1-like [Macadamia integrifolia]XP_042499510.1 disease resistance protein RUN1-like [Macadamia integrifolia]